MRVKAAVCCVSARFCSAIITGLRLHGEVRIRCAATQRDDKPGSRNWSDVSTPAKNLRDEAQRKEDARGAHRKRTLNPTDKNLLTLPAMLKDVAVNKSRVLVPATLIAVPITPDSKITSQPPIDIPSMEEMMPGTLSEKRMRSNVTGRAMRLL